MSSDKPRHGGQALVEGLEAQGVTRVFCIPGESYLAALDGLYDSGIETIVTRHEGGAAMMAEAHGKLTGKPGIAFVTRGPGATNASAGVHIAFQDSTPMILFVGQVASDQRDREAFQEVDYRAMFAPLAKRVLEIDRADRIPEYVSHAFHVAQTGRPGPVVVSLPEDVLSAHCAAPAVPAAVVPGGKAAEADIDAILAKLEEAENPFILVGGPQWSQEAATSLGAFAEKMGIPVGVSFRCQDYLDNRHPCYAGDVGIGPNPKLARRVSEADVLLCLGARLGEMTTSGYTLLEPPVIRQQLIHVHPDPSEPGRVYHPALSVAAKAGEVIQQLAGRVAGLEMKDQKQVQMAHASYEAWQIAEETPGSLKMENVILHLRDTLADDAIITNGAGNYASWLHRYYKYRSWRTQLAPTSGSMGYGLPAAVSAKLHHPDRDVICLAGDGCIQMSIQEFGTACQYGANIIVLVSNNGMYGTIRMHQQKHYPHRPSGTQMVNPEFADIAKAYDGFGAIVKSDADFVEAFAEARAANRPAIIDMKVSPDALSPKLILESDKV
ncbi:MAG: thiamine pyrophosphate-binding protein [Pseudomonadota bacterium]